MIHLALLTVAAASAGPTIFHEALPDDAPVQIEVALLLRGQTQLDRLLADQQDPSSPSFRQWLTPEQFGERFGVPLERYEKFVSWLETHGFTVTRYPNRLFLEAVGTVDGVRNLLGVQLREASAGTRRFRSYEGDLQIPADLAPDVLLISGLDTRIRLRRHRLDAHVNATDGNGGAVQALGPADLRLEYDVPAPTGSAAAGLTTVVLGTQEGTTPSSCATSQAYVNGTAPWIPPSTQAIQAYFTLGGATATYNPIQLPNANADFDTCGANSEYQLDVEMQSVGAANAQDIDLVASPSSVIFEAGAQYIANMLPTATVMSTSLGLCEPEEAQGGNGPGVAGSEPTELRQTVQQGSAEGQTWFVASGDDGADDCDDGTTGGYDGGEATVDFPGSIPEFVDVGGTMFSGAASWNAQGALTAYGPETTWSESNCGAGGGGQSVFYSKPAYQVGVGPAAGDGARDVPDLSFEASSSYPGTAIYDCGAGQDSTCSGNTTGSGTLDSDSCGTSFSAPMAAGFFAYISGQLGCKLGDIHTQLYALGQGAKAATALHDITTGNNSWTDDQTGALVNGFDAVAGYDLATGWGSVDVTQMVAAWPGCPVIGGSSSSSGGVSGSSSSSGTSSAVSSSGGGSSPVTTSRSSAASTPGGSSGGGTSNLGSSGTASTSANSGGGFVQTSSLGGSSSSSAGSSSGSSSGCSCGTTGTGDAAVFGALLWLGLALLRRRPVA
jgi:MYXO-CTERM domain-containing protein